VKTQYIILFTFQDDKNEREEKDEYDNRLKNKRKYKSLTLQDYQNIYINQAEFTTNFTANSDGNINLHFAVKKKKISNKKIEKRT
jgi:hypothetical protein